MRRRARIVVIALIATACLGVDTNVTESGKGVPEVTLDFPRSVDTGSTSTLRVSVANPGPGDIDSLFIAFAAVGIGGRQGNALPLVVPTRRGTSRSVAAVQPDPVAVGGGGVIFRFGPLDVDESADFNFEIVAPEEPGTYANSVQAYDGLDTERISGVALETEVRG